MFSYKPNSILKCVHSFYEFHDVLFKTLKSTISLEINVDTLRN